jgi:hypothetical protein
MAATPIGETTAAHVQGVNDAAPFQGVNDAAPFQGVNDAAPFQEAIPAETTVAPQASPTQGPVTFQEAFASCEFPFLRSQLTDLTFRVVSKHCRDSIPSPSYLRN